MASTIHVPVEDSSMKTSKQTRGPLTSFALLAIAVSLAGVRCDASKTSVAADPPSDHDKAAPQVKAMIPVAQQTLAAAAAPTAGKKPNILFIMGDDIGWMQPSIYHRGLMVGETPNIDRIGHEGAIYMDYVAMQSCTSGRNAFITGMCT
jgi:arylsulfatase A-like enzyme